MDKKSDTEKLKEIRELLEKEDNPEIKKRGEEALRAYERLAKIADDLDKDRPISMFDVINAGFDVFVAYNRLKWATGK